MTKALKDHAVVLSLRGALAREHSFYHDKSIRPNSAVCFSLPPNMSIFFSSPPPNKFKYNHTDTGFDKLQHCGD